MKYWSTYTIHASLLYPGGMAMPNRNIEDSNGYRYAFQGQEKDPETGKEAFQLRLWDGRIGRWLTTDPYGQYASPYLGMGNNPIGLIDRDGGFADCPECDQNAPLGSTQTDSAGFDWTMQDDGWARSDGYEVVVSAGLDAWDVDILNRGLNNYAPKHSYDFAKWEEKSLRSKLNHVKRLDWTEAHREVARENIGSVYKAAGEYGMLGSGLYSGNMAKVAPNAVRTANAAIDESLQIVQIIGDDVIHLSKVQLIDRTHSVYSKLPPAARRNLFKAQKALIKERNTTRNIINTRNIEKLAQKFRSIFVEK